MATVVDTVRVDICTDCLMWDAGYDEHERGDTPETPDTVRDAEYARLVADSGGSDAVFAREDPFSDGAVCPCWEYGDMHPVTGEACSCRDASFSWSPCDWCGDRFGGDRWGMVVTVFA